MARVVVYSQLPRCLFQQWEHCKLTMVNAKALSWPGKHIYKYTQNYPLIGL